MADTIATAAAAFKGALFDIAVDLWKDDHDELLVSYGATGTNVPDDYVVFGDLASGQEDATFSPERSRDETLTLDVEFYIFRPGVEEAEREAVDYLYARLGELERYVRMTDPRLGGVVERCKLASHRSTTAEYKTNAGAGRLAAAVATFEAFVRIRG